MLSKFAHLLIFVSLTLLTQIGGFAWLVALFFKRRVAVFLVCYLLFWGGAFWTAPYFGRVPLACWESGTLEVHSWFYCATNRTYMKPGLLSAIQDASERVDEKFPGTTTLLLDANFPFLSGFPLLPHLSHDDGEKADLAFFYADNGQYLRGKTRSPIGYLAFETGPSQCEKSWPTLRWDLDILQGLWKSHELEPQRTASLIQALSQDEKVEKIFVEPHLTKRLGLQSPKIRFQGCRAARHDDHIHLQISR